MANIMQRKFTLRERILMLILLGILLIGLYFLLVYYPVKNRINELESNSEDLAVKEYVLQSRESTYNKMKAELEEISKMDPNDVTEIPKYNNSDNLIKEIGEILKRVSGTIDTNIVDNDDNIYIRTVRLSFSISGFQSEQFDSDYIKTKSVIYDLSHIKYRSQIKSLDIRGSKDVTEDKSLTVSCTLTFYERV